MNKSFRIILIAILCVLASLSLHSCYRTDQEYNTDEVYQEGYDEGYEDGWDALFDVMYDELVYEESEKNELIHLVFEALHDGKELKNNETYHAGNFVLRYHFEQERFLYFDIKFTNFDIKTICNGDMHDFMDNLPVTCYIGFYDEYGEWTTRKEYFVGEKILFDEFEFTSDGYLTDYVDYYDAYNNSNTLYILLCINEELYTATYSTN